MELSKTHTQIKDGPVIVIIGAYGGVGGALTSRLGRVDANLILVGRDAEKLASLADQVDGIYGVADASDFQELTTCTDAVMAKYGRIDGVACVTGSLYLKPAHLTTETDWQSVLATNLTTAFNTVRTSARAMMKNGGSIVLMSSVAARLGLPNHEALAAAKAGVEGLARSAAATYARRKIRINCVAPGLLDTPLTANVTGNANTLEAILTMYPIPRLGTADEIAGVIDWLLGDDSSWVTGQTISVDGGLSSLRISLSKVNSD